MDIRTPQTETLLVRLCIHLLSYVQMCMYVANFPIHLVNAPHPLLKLKVPLLRTQDKLRYHPLQSCSNREKRSILLRAEAER